MVFCSRIESGLVSSVQGTSVCQVTMIGATVILLYSSRACYNLVVLALAKIKSINSFDYDWYNVSDQVCSMQLFDRGNAIHVQFQHYLFLRHSSLKQKRHHLYAKSDPYLVFDHWKCV